MCLLRFKVKCAVIFRNVQTWTIDLMVYLCRTPYLDIKDMKVNDEEGQELLIRSGAVNFDK